MRTFLISLCTLFSVNLPLAAVVEKSTTPASPVYPTAGLKASISEEVSISMDAKNRMQDIIEAFNLLRREKGAPKVYMLLQTGEKINQIIDLSPMTNQTLLLIRYSTNQGNQLKVVGIEDIDGVACLP